MSIINKLVKIWNLYVKHDKIHHKKRKKRIALKRHRLALKRHRTANILRLNTSTKALLETAGEIDRVRLRIQEWYSSIIYKRERVKGYSYFSRKRKKRIYVKSYTRLRCRYRNRLAYLVFYMRTIDDDEVISWKQATAMFSANDMETLDEQLYANYNVSFSRTGKERRGFFNEIIKRHGKSGENILIDYVEFRLSKVR